MMIVPRSFSGHLNHRKSLDFSEKEALCRTRPVSRSPKSHSPLSTSPSPTRINSNVRRESRSDPVRIPSRSKKTQKNGSRAQAASNSEQPQPTETRRESAREILTTTTIPIRRKPKPKPSQRLPVGDHVADFSRILREDVKSSRDGSLPRSISSSHLDGLFGNMDELLEEGNMFLGSESVDVEVLSKRSLSNESLNSMASPDELGLTDNPSAMSSMWQSTPEKKLRQIASSIDCGEDHPLSVTTEEESLGSLPEMSVSPPTATRKQSVLPGDSLRRSFKSSLTASLKAIKSAAQNVSYNTTGVPKPPENVIAHSFFDIQPSLTDDRRPPPLDQTPSAEVRRYLNPPPLDSAAQLHFWQDHRYSKFDHPPSSNKSQRKSKNSKRKIHTKTGFSSSLTRNLPLDVPLATCLPSSIRTAHASSPPIWLAPDGTPTNKNTATPLLYNPDAICNGAGETGLMCWRNREPRENRDFLRVYVCEMEMRRHGKLSEDLSAGRARLWLPPVDDQRVKMGNNGSGSGSGSDRQVEQLQQTNGAVISPVGARSERRRVGKERLQSWTVD